MHLFSSTFFINLMFANVNHNIIITFRRKSRGGSTEDAKSSQASQLKLYGMAHNGVFKMVFSFKTCV